MTDTMQRQEMAQRWVEMVLGERPHENFPVALYSGDRLCSLVNKIYRALGRNIRVGPRANKARRDEAPPANEQEAEARARRHVEEYLEACSSLGVQEGELFDADDLLKFENLEKVYTNILALQSVAMNLSYRRSLEDRHSNPSDHTEGSSETHTGRNSRLDHALLTNISWYDLLSQYESAIDRHYWPTPRGHYGSSAQISSGMGQAAHDLWRVEERIRMALTQDPKTSGVPTELHGRLWMLASGAYVLQRVTRGKYDELSTASVDDSEAVKEIDADLNRTVSLQDRESWTCEQTDRMRRVLVAYSQFNPTLGYCQGLNCVVARALQFLSEEQAFYLLVKVVEMMPEDYYTTMLGLAIDQHVYADLVRVELPDVVEHMTSLGGSGMELSLACTEWFLTAFASPCSKEVTTEIWDRIFLFGNSVLFHAALSLMRMEKTRFLDTNNMGDMLKVLNELGQPSITAQALIEDCSAHDRVATSRLDDLRAHHRLQLASTIATQLPDTTSDAPLHVTEQNKRRFTKHNKNVRVGYTQDRTISDDQLVKMQQSDPNTTQFYPERPFEIVDEYWGSAQYGSLWETVDVRLLSSPTDDKSVDSDNLVTISESEHQSVNSEPQGRGSRHSRHSSRERRRKSSAIPLMQSKRVKSDGQRKKKEKEKKSGQETPLKSPINFLHRLGEWSQSLKQQKQRRKTKKISTNISRQSLPHTKHDTVGWDVENERSKSVYDISDRSAETEVDHSQRESETPVMKGLAAKVEMADLSTPDDANDKMPSPLNLPSAGNHAGLVRSQGTLLEHSSYEDLMRTFAESRFRHAPSSLYGTRSVRSGVNARSTALRDRAQVVSYLSRKASDASSLSMSRSPVGLDTSRFSETSSGSQRLSDRMNLSNRKSSFPFFDKLSFEVEQSVDEIRNSVQSELGAPVTEEEIDVDEMDATSSTYPLPGMREAVLVEESKEA